jgi:hypothetical protein
MVELDGTIVRDIPALEEWKTRSGGGDRGALASGINNVDSLIQQYHTVHEWSSHQARADALARIRDAAKAWIAQTNAMYWVFHSQRKSRLVAVMNLKDQAAAKCEELTEAAHAGMKPKSFDPFFMRRFRDFPRNQKGMLAFRGEARAIDTRPTFSVRTAEGNITVTVDSILESGGFWPYCSRLGPNPNVTNEGAAFDMVFGSTEAGVSIRYARGAKGIQAAPRVLRGGSKDVYLYVLYLPLQSALLTFEKARGHNVNSLEVDTMHVPLANIIGYRKIPRQGDHFPETFQEVPEEFLHRHSQQRRTHWSLRAEEGYDQFLEIRDAERFRLAQGAI